MSLSVRQWLIIMHAAGVTVDADDVFISDGAKSDTGNITELFAKDNVILVLTRCTRSMWIPIQWTENRSSI